LFKLIGVIAGFGLFGFTGAIIGFLLGAFIDRARALGVGGVNPLTNALRQTVFLQTVFTLMGKLVKADGHISQAEIDHIEQFIEKLGMTPAHRTQAIAWFKQGADPAFVIEPACQRFMAVCGQTRDLKHMLLVYLVVIAVADGHFHAAEEALLAQIAAQLGYDQAAFRQLVDTVLGQAHFGADQANPAAALDDAYQALGVSKDSSDQDIKRAYRKLMSQYHPDKLMGQGVPEDMIAVATEQAKEIQLAYDLIKKSRNLA
jgi:DnaJ like chaperone protein